MADTEVTVKRDPRHDEGGVRDGGGDEEHVHLAQPVVVEAVLHGLEHDGVGHRHQTRDEVSAR